jgi:hypothetical protein
MTDLAEFFLKREMFETTVVEKIKSQILCSIIFFSKNLAICEIMQKNTVESVWPHMTT